MLIIVVDIFVIYLAKKVVIIDYRRFTPHFEAFYLNRTISVVLIVVSNAKNRIFISILNYPKSNAIILSYVMTFAGYAF